jgi:hypothetical protein
MPIPARWRPEEAALSNYGDDRHALAITDTGIAIERFCREADPFVTLSVLSTTSPDSAAKRAILGLGRLRIAVDTSALGRTHDA